nr:unnamed protein product [Callosobruchus analis]
MKIRNVNKTRNVRDVNHGNKHAGLKLESASTTVLMAVVDANYRFLMIDVGAYGKDSDAGVFSNSPIYQNIENGTLPLPKGQKLPNSEQICPFVFIGDEAFPLRTYLLRPFPRRRLQNNEPASYYNYRLSRARMTVECTFGICSAKFRILLKSIDTKVENAVHISKAICILHNLIIDMEKESFLDDLQDYTGGNLRKNHTSLRVAMNEIGQEGQWSIQEVSSSPVEGSGVLLGPFLPASCLTLPASLWRCTERSLDRSISPGPAQLGFSPLGSPRTPRLQRKLVFCPLDFLAVNGSNVLLLHDHSAHRYKLIRTKRNLLHLDSKCSKFEDELHRENSGEDHIKLLKHPFVHLELIFLVVELHPQSDGIGQDKCEYGVLERFGSDEPPNLVLYPMFGYVTSDWLGFQGELDAISLVFV